MATRKTHAFTKKAFQSKTPQWAKITFRVIMYLNAAITGWLGATNLVDINTKMEVAIILNCFITPGAHLLSNMFGVEE